MKLTIFILMIFFSRLGLSQIESQRTISQRIIAENVNEAKSFLVHSAVLETIEKHSEEFGINFSDFNQKLEQKFNSFFEEYKKRSLEKNFGKDFSKSLTEEQKKSFLQGLEDQRPQQMIKYAKFKNLLDSYAFRMIENAPNDPAVWKAVVVLKLNREKLIRYNSRLRAQNSKQYSKIQILTDINLLGMSWADLGLDKGATFTAPLLNSWQNWMSSNMPVNVEEISLCTDDCISEFLNWQQIPQEEGMNTPDDLVNSLWLRVSFNLRKAAYMPAINEWHFEWDGSLVLLDANTKKNLFSQTLKLESKTWRGLDQKSLNSNLASALYRSPLEGLVKVVRKVQETPRLNALNRLLIQGHRHLGDVIRLTEMLRKLGTGIGLELSLDAFSRNEAELLCFYQGEEKSFTDLLSQVKELKSSHSYRLVNEFTGVHHVLKLVAE